MQFRRVIFRGLLPLARLTIVYPRKIYEDNFSANLDLVTNIRVFQQNQSGTAIAGGFGGFQGLYGSMTLPD